MIDNSKYRTESDLLGSMNIPIDTYWGIHTQRALGNFSIEYEKVPFILILAYSQVKKAAALANAELKYLPQDIANTIATACDEICLGKFNDYFPISAIQGGAGTSLNMNINEVIANRACELAGQRLGSYEVVSPIEHVNLHQSTNDTYPTALKIAAIYGFRKLSKELELLQGIFNQKEKEFASVLTIGRTQLMPAVPATLGSIFGAYAEAFARDRWRTFKCEERLRTINIGGTAIGTGLTAPRNYIFLVIEKLREVTGLGLTRAEQLIDATCNNDTFSEVSGILNSLSASLIKISADLRLMHSFGEIQLPAVQAGSSIMPGKVNPVIAEFVASCGIKAQANDAMLNNCISRGSLQINEFMPLIAYSLLDSLHILTSAVSTFHKYVANIRVDIDVCKKHFEENECIITAFVPILGYYECEQLIKDFKCSEYSNIKEFLSNKLGAEKVEKILSASNLTSLGYRTK